MKIVSLILGSVVIFAVFAYFFVIKGQEKTEAQSFKQEEVTEETASKSNVKDIQEINVKVDGSNYPGYFASKTEVKKDVPVRLNFITENEQSCALAVNISAANVYNKILPETGTTPIDFTPTKEGEFLIYCGMNGMFSVAIKVIA